MQKFTFHFYNGAERRSTSNTLQPLICQ